MKTRVLLSLLLIALSPGLLAQNEPNGSIQIGAGIVAFSYRGDLNDEEFFLDRVYPGGNFSVQFDSKSRFRFQLNAGFGSFIAQTSSEQLLTGDFGRANTFVQTSFFVSDLRLQLRILKNTKFQPYLAAGGGMMLFNPRDEEGNFLGENVFTREANESYNTTIPVIPLAAGMQMRVNRIISLSMEYNYRVVPSDYLDNVGQLGKRDGDDILQGLQLAVHFNLNPVATPMPPELIPATDPDYLVQNLSTGTEDSTSVGISIEQEEDSLTDTTPSSIEGKTIGDWLKLEKEALFKRKFIYLKVKAGQTLQQYADHFHVRPETIRRINFMINNELVPGSQIRLPDTGVSPDTLPPVIQAP